MLYTCYLAEKKKLKSSYVWILFVCLPLLPAAFGTMNYLNNLGVLKDGWYSLWTQHTLFYADFFFAPLISIYASFLFRLEHFDHNWNQFYTTPVPLSYLYLAKFFVLVRLSFFTQIWVFVLFYGLGIFIGLPLFVPIQLFFWLMQGFLGGFTTIAIQLFLSMKIKSFSIPVFISLAGSILSLYAINSGKGFFIPYAYMMLGMNANTTSSLIGSNTALFLFGTIAFTFIFIFLAIFHLRTKDITTSF